MRVAVAAEELCHSIVAECSGSACNLNVVSRINSNRGQEGPKVSIVKSSALLNASLGYK